MPLEAGTRLGPYQITGRLGAGGMGEVYRAQDARLHREVALKVLPAEFAQNASRRLRFEQEARAAAALNHPNIVGIYDIGTDEPAGIFYMVSELVAGETLDAVIGGSPLPMKRLLDIASQIADGMAGAHAAGITHRDLKPANVMVTPDGRAKILDFGLAKQSPAAAPDASDADATRTVALTQAGTILGTANYMSPEQASGKPVDPRSDQFSFGVILYEMITGKKAFARDSAVQTMSAILTDEAPPIEREIPDPLRWLVDRCLSKQPVDRYESTRDLYLTLRNIREHLSSLSSSGSGPPAVLAPPPAAGAIAAPQPAPDDSPRARLGWPGVAVAAVALIAGFALATWLAGTSPPGAQAYKYTPFSFEPRGQGAAVWSPDGSAVAFLTATGPGTPQVHLRYLDSETAFQVTDIPEGGRPVGWTPDGGRILFTTSREPAGLWSVAPVGGQPQPVLTYPVAETRPIAVAPDAMSAAFLQADEEGEVGLWISAPLGAAPERYLPDPFATPNVANVPQLAFSPDGTKILLYLNRGEGEEAWLLSYPAGSGSAPHRVLAAVRSVFTPSFSWMPDNRHVILAPSANFGDPAQLWIGDTESDQLTALVSGTSNWVEPRVSPDGTRLLFSEGTVDFDLASVSLAGGEMRSTMSTQRSEEAPSWGSPSEVMAYVTDRNGPLEIWVHRPGESDRPLVTASEVDGGVMGPAVSPQGDRVIYTVILGSNIRLYISSLAGGEPVALTDAAQPLEFPGSWSPDGNQFVYWSVGTGQMRLMRVQTSGQQTPQELTTASNTNGAVPIWSPNGDWIGYYDGALKLISPDGTQKRELPLPSAWAYQFSADGSLLYGILREPDGWQLISADVATGQVRRIRTLPEEYAPSTRLNPSARLSRSPDGKSLLYSVRRASQNLWLMEGLASKPPGLLERLGLR